MTHAEHWRQRGTSIEAIRAVARASAAEIRRVWDYRAEGLDIDAAREAIATHAPRPSRGGWRGQQQRTLAAADRHSVLRHDPDAGRILMLLYDRRRQAAQWSARVARARGPAAWLAWAPDWRHPLCSWLLPDGRLVETVRHEDCTWEHRRRYPTSRSTSYQSRVVQWDARTCRAVDVSQTTHDARGDWRSRVLTALGLVCPGHVADRADVSARLHPACVARDRHTVGSYRIGERTLCGARLDYYARHRDGTVYHAPTVAQAVAGCETKRRHAAAAARGELLSAAVARERWGFCRAGIAEFAAACGLDVSGAYTIEEVRAALTDDIRARFAQDLEVAGI